jgi:preprotein translocase subunit SecA
MSLLDKLFGDPNAKEVKRLEPTIARVNALENEIQKLSDAKIKERFQAIKAAVEKELAKDKNKTEDKESLRKVELDVIEPHIPEVFALIRESAKRTIGQRHYDVQLMGGLILHSGKIAEMKTGEGKTLVATLAVALNALCGKGVHVVTVNDYLARRDAGWMGRIYSFLGLTCSTIVHDKAYLFDKEYLDEKALDEKTQHLREITRKEAYLADITYGTNNEFGFDYLRDNMAQNQEQMVQRPLHFAIVDEVDSILIDEARTPLIISAPAEEATDKYYQFAQLVRQLKAEKDYEVDEKVKAVTLTDEGITHMEKLLGVENVYEAYGIENVHHIEQALRSEVLFKKDRDYVVKDGEIIIVDEFTGRLMIGRRYSEGLHQAIEAKEGVEIKKESITLATISFQNYFRLYVKLSGMTGTAATEAEEFHKIYKLEVVIVPTNRPMIREDLADVIYKTERSKFLAIVQDIKERHKKGQPVLVGTVSIEKNELLSDLLKREGIKHELLNAKNHEKEAMIIANAGQKGAVTVSTNMAGRGTDILLDESVIELGGLHVIGSERHESRRIDNQLRGRAGRQGDPGSTQFFVSLQDDLMRIFGSDRVGTMMERLGLPEDTPIQHGLISKSLEQAQKKVESQNFDIRKHLVEYDDVMNRQREFIYGKRRLAMGSESLKDEFLDYFDGEADRIVGSFINAETEELETEKLDGVVKFIIPELSKDDEKSLKKPDTEEATKNLKNLFKKYYEEKEKSLGADMMRILEHALYLRTIDMLWVNHLDAMDHLREGIGLRGYGQKDPLIEYKNESYNMFQTLLGAIQAEIVNTFFKVTVTQNAPAPEGEVAKAEEDALEGKADFEGAREEDTTGEVAPSKKSSAKIGRNDPCPCGSGKKYKKCCGKDK